MIVVDEIATIAPTKRLALPRQSERGADDGAEHEHQPDLDHGRDHGAHADAHHAAHAQLEPDREHEQDDAELGQRRDHALVGDEPHARVRADQDAGDEVAQDDRQAQALEHHRRHGGGADDERQRLDQRVSDHGPD